MPFLAIAGNFWIFENFQKIWKSESIFQINPAQVLCTLVIDMQIS